MTQEKILLEGLEKTKQRILKHIELFKRLKDK